MSSPRLVKTPSTSLSVTMGVDIAHQAPRQAMTWIISCRTSASTSETPYPYSKVLTAAKAQHIVSRQCPTFQRVRMRLSVQSLYGFGRRMAATLVRPVAQLPRWTVKQAIGIRPHRRPPKSRSQFVCVFLLLQGCMIWVTTSIMGFVLTHSSVACDLACPTSLITRGRAPEASGHAATSNVIGSIRF